MGGSILRTGQPQLLPGVAFQITSGEPQPNTADGVVGFVGKANRGPIGSTTRILGLDQLARVYGTPGETGNTMDAVMQIFQGGAVAVEVTRVGNTTSPATVAAIQLKDDSVAPGVSIAQVSAKDVGSGGNNISVTVRTNAIDATKRDLVVYDSGVQREIHTYSPGTDGAAALVAQLAVDGSDYIVVTRLALGTGRLATVSNVSLIGGANPTIVNADYSTALSVVGRRSVRTIAVDTEDTTAQGVVKAAADGLFLGGRRRLVVVGMPTTTTWSARKTQALSLSDPVIVMTGGGFDYQDTQGNWVTVDGYKAAARHAGELSILPLGRQMTLRAEPGAQRLREYVNGVSVAGAAPDDTQLADAVASGIILWTTSDTGRIVTLEGNTTYKAGDPAPTWADSVDPGWSKSRLVLTRNRVLDAIYTAWEPLVPDYSNNDAGRESLIRAAKNVIEQQFQPSGAVGDYNLYVSSDDPPFADHATFNLDMQTPDGLERLRMVARFRR